MQQSSYLGMPRSNQKTETKLSGSNHSFSSETSGSFSMKHLASTLSVMTVSESSYGAPPVMTQEEIDALPDYYEEPSSWQKKPKCDICGEEYKLITNREHHCRKCKKSICGSCGAFSQYMDKRRQKKYRICISCDTLHLNKDILATYDQLNEDLMQEIETLKAKLEGHDKDVGEVESQLKMLEIEVASQKSANDSKYSKVTAEVHAFIDQVKAKKSRVLELQKYVDNAQTSLMDVKMRIEEGKSQISIKKEEMKEKENKIYKLDAEIEEEQKSLEWKQTVRKKRMMKEEPPDMQTTLIKKKHKLTMEEIKESIVESNVSSDEENQMLKRAFKSELNSERLLSISDQGNRTYLSLDPK